MDASATPLPAPTSEPEGQTRRNKRWAWPLLITISFLNAIGLTIVFPVLPFVTLGVVSDEASLALWVGVLEATFALCAFLVAPLLGSLSDRYGRRPILIYSLFGAAVGYLLFGLAGSLITLIVARIIQGLASGDMPALFGYVADITEEKDRAKRFGLLGALMGIASMVGPALGGMLSRISLNAPVFATAALSVIVALLSLAVLPESLDKENRRAQLRLADLNPLTTIRDALARPTLRPLLVGALLITIPFSFFVANFSVVALDTVSWGPSQVGLFLTVNGLLDIVIQGGLLAILLPRIGERGIVIAGVVGQAAGCLGLAVTASLLNLPWLFAAAGIVFAAGQGGMTAALDGLMSSSVGQDEQGWLAGAFSSLSSATQVIAPLAGGWIYAAISHGAPYWLSFAMIVVAAVVLNRATVRKPASLA